MLDDFSEDLSAWLLVEQLQEKFGELYGVLAEFDVGGMLQHFEVEVIDDVSSEGFVSQRKKVSEHNEAFIIDEFGLFAYLKVINNTEAAVDQEILHFTKIRTVLLQTFQNVRDGRLSSCRIVQRPLPYFFGTMRKKVEMLMVNLFQPAKDNREELYNITSGSFLKL